MSFQYRELAVQVGAGYEDELSTCTGWTKPTGCDVASEMGVQEHRTTQLDYLKQQLRQVVEPA